MGKLTGINRTGKQREKQKSVTGGRKAKQRRKRGREENSKNNEWQNADKDRGWQINMRI